MPDEKGDPTYEELLTENSALRLRVTVAEGHARSAKRIARLHLKQKLGARLQAVRGKGKHEDTAAADARARVLHELLADFDTEE